jgi:hypothetical protein
MYICAEYLKMPHYKFKEMPLPEQLKWLIYVEEEAKQKKKENDRLRTNAEIQKAKANAKKNPSTGVHKKR